MSKSKKKHAQEHSQEHAQPVEVAPDDVVETPTTENIPVATIAEAEPVATENIPVATIAEVEPVAIVNPVVTTPVEAKAEKPAKTPREKKPKVRWSEMWKTAPDKVDARVAKGLPAFEPNSKRQITRDLLEKEGGCTVAEACKALGWDIPTVKSAFTEIAYLLRKRVVLQKVDGEPSRYSIVATTPEQEAERKSARQAAREARKAELEAKRQTALAKQAVETPKVEAKDPPSSEQPSEEVSEQLEAAE